MAAEPGVVLLLGAPDTGKSTLAVWLVNAGLEAGRRVAVVDADVGQSDIGPPGTVGLGFPRASVERLAQIPARALAFVGATSPAGQVAPHLVATSAMVAKARAEGAELVVVDTTGVGSGLWGRTLKELKIEATAPAWVVALEREAELTPLLRGLRGRLLPRVARLPASGRARERSREERRAIRQKLLGRYLEQAAPLELSLNTVGFARSFWQGDLAGEVPAEEFRHLWVGLGDARGEVLAAGTILEISYQAGILRVLTPWREAEAVRTVILGSLRVTPEGREEGRLPG